MKLTYPNAPQGTQTNIAKVKVNLPRQLPSRLTTLAERHALTVSLTPIPRRVPLGQRWGTPRRSPRSSQSRSRDPPITVRTGGAKFPELIIVLQGYGVTLDLRSETFISKKGITSSTFRQVPDDPVGSFELTLPQGPGSASPPTATSATPN